MRILLFGLTITSAWGNDHAAVLRPLCLGLARRGHHVTVFERDEAWHAAMRDMPEPAGATVVLYRDWECVRPRAMRVLREADVGIVTSRCPDGAEATALVLDAGLPVSVFYDLDPAVTLAGTAGAQRPTWLPPEGLAGFDLVLGLAGGAALEGLREGLGAHRVAALHPSVDPHWSRPVPPVPRYRADLACLGAEGMERVPGLHALFLEAARRLPERRLLLGGTSLPQDLPALPNLRVERDLPPDAHQALLCSARLALSLKRPGLARCGWCPPARLLEAAACGVPVLSEWWEGLDHFFHPGREILVVRGIAELLAAMERDDAALGVMAGRARARVLEEHGCDRRAAEMEAMLERLGSHEAKELEA